MTPESKMTKDLTASKLLQKHIPLTAALLQLLFHPQDTPTHPHKPNQAQHKPYKFNQGRKSRSEMFISIFKYLGGARCSLPAEITE